MYRRRERERERERESEKKEKEKEKKRARQRMRARANGWNSERIPRKEKRSFLGGRINAATRTAAAAATAAPAASSRERGIFWRRGDIGSSCKLATRSGSGDLFYRSTITPLRVLKISAIIA